ncbi:2-keto-4-pentenoate hydratase [Vineibacter terrae]|uniref:2-keto-4-pentenoate hydratase n=1 Tax=Vineibacter terrae TaxID=2586908 RepID=UPI002E30C9A1|nr:fumarylacetoacetate hydrolase family protein [Vineibacter terrae]HEX2888273.1 fumarylacetoacetate hydrolase family protein [Vineibacter terrae]
MTDADIAALADRIAMARQKKTVIDFLPGALAEGTEADAYKVQFAVHERLTAAGADRIAGWKVAATLPAQYQPIGLSGPAFAGIYQSGIKLSGATFPKGSLRKYGIECEVVARIAREVPAQGARYDAESIKPFIGGLFCGMEVVENRFADVAKADGKCRIADEFLQAACIVGPEIANWQSLDLAAVHGRSLHDGKELAAGPGANVMGNPLSSLAWLANQLIARGKTLRAGDTVLTGSTHPPQFLSGPGEAVSEFVGIGETRVTFG